MEAPPLADTRPPRARIRVTRGAAALAGWTLLVIVGVLALAEITARTRVLADVLPSPGWTGLRYVDGKLTRLETMVERRGRLDCVMVGASPVEWGIDPRGLAEAYVGRRGGELVAFNLGMAGLGYVTLDPIATMLRRRYDPGLIVVGVSIIGLDDRFGMGLEQFLEDAPWIRFHRGAFLLEGWLTEHAAAYRQYLGIHTTMSARRPAPRAGRRAQSTAEGWVPHDGSRLSVNEPPRADGRSFQLAEREGEELARTIALIGAGRVAVVEMPLHASARFVFVGGEAIYDRARVALQAWVARTGAPFWRTDELGLIPDDGWFDRGHLNRLGATVFSRWLGAQLAEAVERGILRDPASRPTR